MQLLIEKASVEDIQEVSKMYDDLNDYLEQGVNYCGWKKGVYPTIEDAENGVNRNDLFVARYNGEVVGSIILNHEPEKAYVEADWSFESDYSDVYVVHTFLVHPKFLGKGLGVEILNFADDYCKSQGAKAIRLDTYAENMPAVKLYEKCGYRYAGTVDLGYSQYGLDWYKLFEKIL